MSKLKFFEQIIFYIIVFSLPFQLRFVLHDYALGSLAEFSTLFLYATDILVVLLIIIFIIRYIGYKSLREFLFSRWRAIHESDPLYLFLISFLVITILASFPTRSLGISLYHIAKTAEFLLFFIYIVLSFKQYSLTAVLKVFIASVLFQSIIGFLQFTFEKSLSLRFLGESVLAPDFPEVVRVFVEQFFVLRAYGTLPHPNLLAIYIIIGLFFIAYLILKKRFFADYPNPAFLPKEEERSVFKDSFGRVFLFVVVFWFFVGIFLTFSRTVLLIGLIALFGMLLWLWRRFMYDMFRQRALYVAIVFFILALVSGVIFRSELSARFQSGIERTRVSWGIFDAQALSFIRENPLFGIGAGYYPFKLNQMDITLPPPLLQPVNNLYLLIASEIGLIGFAFFIAFLAYLAYGLVRAYVREKDSIARLWKSHLIVLFVFMCVVSFFTHSFWAFQQGRLLFWFLLGILVATATETKMLQSDSA